MGDTGEDFKALREWRKRKRASNQRKSTQLLEFLNVPFKSHNAGIHLVVTYQNKVVDFYPSTGLWIDRETALKRRSVKSLLNYLDITMEPKK